MCGGNPCLRPAHGARSINCQEPTLDADSLRKQKLHNSLHALLLVLLMGGLLGYLAWLIGGIELSLLALALVFLLYSLTPRWSPGLVTRLYRLSPIGPRSAPELYAITEALARRAGLDQVPRLFHAPSSVLNAFAVGDRDSAAIALSDGLLRRLSLEEIAGVLAHEISHIAHDDMGVMALADLLDRVTRILSLTGQVLLLINLPLVLFTSYALDWFAIAVLLLAPTITGLGQLALSRSREFNADTTAAQLLGDPAPLVAALAKIERQQGRLFEQLLGPGQRLPDPSLLRTHPPTGERIRRLRALAQPAPVWEPLPAPRSFSPQPFHGVRVQARPLGPRWHLNGTWY